MYRSMYRLTTMHSVTDRRQTDTDRRHYHANSRSYRTACRIRSAKKVPFYYDTLQNTILSVDTPV